MRVAVIGAGIAGLAACKYCKEYKLDVDCFEQTNNIGGTWVYYDQTGVDKHGLQIHSSMYRNLHTNLPKETMGYHEFPFTGFERSYVTPQEVVDYLESYVVHFRLRDHIKLEHLVTKVEPVEGKWRVSTQDLVKDEALSAMYDAVFVCNGHHATPRLPTIDGIENFKGKVMHSREYRYPELFKDQKVLVIGAGPSGVDITKDLSTTAALVGFSHHLPGKLENVYDSNVMQLPDVVQILQDGKVHFYDGEVVEFDVILYCTGYKYTYNFLSPECQITVDDNHVQDLFKHIININHPTMYFIGIPFTTIIVPLLDLQVRISFFFVSKKCSKSRLFPTQVRFCMKFLTNAVSLPSESQMREDLNQDVYQRQMLNYKKRKMHMLGNDFMRPYLNELATMTNIEPIKPVLLDIYDRARYLMQHDLKNYRKYNYRIIDDYNFVQSREESDMQ